MISVRISEDNRGQTKPIRKTIPVIYNRTTQVHVTTNKVSFYFSDNNRSMAKSQPGS